MASKTGGEDRLMADARGAAQSEGQAVEMT